MRLPPRLPALAAAISIAVAACTPIPLASTTPTQQPMEPVRIGVSAALTGPNAAAYAPTYDAMNVYFQRVNDQGGIGGRRVELIVEDDAGDATRSAANAVRLVQQERVPLLVLASPSASYGPVMTISRSASTPLLIAGACPKETLPPADPLMFCSASFGTAYDSAAALRFIQDAATSQVKLGLLGVDIPLSRAYIDTSIQLAGPAGIQVVAQQVMPLTVTDFTPFATQIAQSGANWAWAGGPWGAEIGPFESLQKLGWTGNYLLYAHQAAEEDFRRRKVDTLYGITSNAMFFEDLPIHREIRAAAERYGSTYPAIELAEGWVTAMAVEEAFRTSGAPSSAAELQASLNRLDVDTRGLRGSRLTFTSDNHFRQTLAYKVYRWDTRQDRIVVARDWEPTDVTAKAR